MNTMTQNLAIAVATGVATGLITGLLTTAFSTWLGLWRHKREQLWAKKVSIYETLLESLTDAVKYYDSELRDLGRDVERDAEFTKALVEKSNQADAEIDRIEAKGALFLSNAAATALRTMRHDLGIAGSEESVAEYFIKSVDAYRKCIRTIREISLSEL